MDKKVRFGFKCGWQWPSEFRINEFIFSCRHDRYDENARNSKYETRFTSQEIAAFQS